ncbi:MAG: metallophosphoesterase [Lachnospiraceae bacterium]|jgi:Icc-related predicted phosphoesterase|nr:metallophosphoesterase [Lachnospiraceae bacterium]
MKILAISDLESRYLWDFYDESKLKGIDLILSCGDLRAEYLSFLVTLAHAPVLYVHGNHDGRYAKKGPEGCTCIEDQIYCYRGLRILGLGGSMLYNAGAHQYTQEAMDRRVRRLRLALIKNGGFDILMTHAPAAGLNDAPDLAHQGFTAFTRLMDQYQPSFFVHGHVHMNYNPSQKRLDHYKNTTVINAYERYVFETEE